jgi:NAD(P)H-dependent FMN reductase
MVLTIISGSPSKTSVSIRIAFYLRKYLQNIIPEAEVNVLIAENMKYRLMMRHIKVSNQHPQHFNHWQSFFQNKWFHITDTRIQWQLHTFLKEPS